ncbi:MAG: CoA transferase, partial [Terriglobia bacterium]
MENLGTSRGPMKCIGPRYQPPRDGAFSTVRPAQPFAAVVRTNAEGRITGGMGMGGPLEGLRVADFSQLVQGPNATQMLADMGADIIKIEPLRGDWQRSWSIRDTYINGE